MDDTTFQATEGNPGVRVRSMRLDDMVRGLYGGPGPVARRVGATVKALTPTQLRRDVARVIRHRVVYGQPPAADEELLSELRRRTVPEVHTLSEYLDRDLVTLWGYDELD